VENLRRSKRFVNEKIPNKLNNHTATVSITATFLYLKPVQFSEIRAQGIASMSITPQESRAARGLLNWTQTQLAHASLVGLSTVRNFEAELRETTVANLAAIVTAFETAGVIFESDGKFVGVKLRVRRGK
jgi:hypothetical protein